MHINERVSLVPYSTLHVGGEARYLTRVATLDALREALTFAGEKDLPWFIVGGGANFFCREEGFPGLVIKMENRSMVMGNGQPEKPREPRVCAGKAEGRRDVTADAGVITRVMVLRAVAHGLRGIEHLAGIPGTVGGAVRGNAGAFGVETKDFLHRVRVLRKTKRGWEEDVLHADQLFFAYRDSTFKREQLSREVGAPPSVIWSATFRLPMGDRRAGERLVAEDLAARKAKQPYEFPSVGSVFTNPLPRHAGQLIESVGLKGFRIGGAEFSGKHANFILNRGGATARDVLALIAEAKQRVRDTCGIPLEEEIVVL